MSVFLAGIFFLGGVGLLGLGLLAFRARSRVLNASVDDMQEIREMYSAGNDALNAIDSLDFSGAAHHMRQVLKPPSQASREDRARSMLIGGIACIVVAIILLLAGAVILSAPRNKPTPEETPAKQKAAEDAAPAQTDEEARSGVEPEVAEWRTWTTADGRHKVEAKAVKFAGGTLTLEKRDGSTVDVNLDILCPDDKDYVQQREWTRPSNGQ